jgi:phosphate transport system substrate-binding protein
VVNVDGIQSGQLRFTGQLLADIYLGKVETWADPAIAALNPGVALPDRRILPVFRTDGSGTTYNWTDYLSRVSGEWKAKVGAGTSVSWPNGAGGNGNGGGADAVARVKGAIGYVEFSYALQRKPTYGLVQNRAGNFVVPSSASFRAAAEGADWSSARDFYLLTTDSPGPQAYPITASSFVLMPAKPKDEAHRRDLLAFFKWALEHGQQQADALGYVPVPDSLVQRIEAYWQARFQ